jgi:hypothetical protein
LGLSQSAGNLVVACGMSDQGQNAKYSFRAHIARFAAGSGLKSDLAGRPFGAKPRHVGSKIVTKKKSRPKAALKLFLMIVDQATINAGLFFRR